MTTLQKIITLKNYTENWICSYCAGLGMDAVEEANELLSDKTTRIETISKFAAFSKTFCENKNKMNKGKYEFISFDGETFVYNVTL
jgi:hypothetical protein